MQNPLVAILIGMVFTAIVQSSSATTGVVIVLASPGLMSLETVSTNVQIASVALVCERSICPKVLNSRWKMRSRMAMMG